MTQKNITLRLLCYYACFKIVVLTHIDMHDIYNSPATNATIVVGHLPETEKLKFVYSKK